MKLHLVVGLGFVGLGLLSAGCGNISITGALGERVLRATGTVAAWVDASTVEPGADGSAQRIDRVTDSTELHLEFFESVFDSRAAVGAVSAAESSALVDDINGGDRLSIRVRRGESVRAGDQIASLPVQGLPPEVLPFVVSTRISLREPIAATAAYPDEIARPGSTVTTTFDVETTTPDLVGTLTIVVDAAEGEDEALTGEFVVEFSAELLPERIAECNFDRFGQGAIDPCTLGPISDAVGVTGLPGADKPDERN